MKNKVKIFQMIIIVAMLLGACGANNQKADEKNETTYQSDNGEDKYDSKVDKNETAHECTEIESPYKTLPYTEDSEMEGTFLK